MSSHMDKSFIPSDTTNTILQTDAKKTPSYSNSLQKTENTDQLLGISHESAVGKADLTIEVQSLPGFPLAHEPGLLIRVHH